jgi:hypothetical protein
MAIYRAPRPRWRATLIGVVVALVVGIGIGFLLGGSEPDPEVAVQEMASELNRTSGTLEVVSIEYSEAVEDGEVVSEPEYEGARAAAIRARSSYDSVREPLALLVPGAVAELDAAFDDLIAAIDEIAPEEDVTQAAEDTSRLLDDFGPP